MKVKDVMSSNPKLQTPKSTLKEIAQEMLELKTGVVPISENDRLVGMVTDRDITIRAVAMGKNPNTPVEQIMTNKVLYCFENDNIDQVLKNMKEQCVQRLVVLDNESDKHLVGMVSLSDIAKECTDDKIAQYLVECNSRDAMATACCA